VAKQPIGKSKGTKEYISKAVKSKIEELVRLRELDMLLERRNLGLEMDGDMKSFVRDLVKKLKIAKNKRLTQPDTTITIKLRTYTQGKWYELTVNCD
jgi:hypothetical protein